MLLGALIILFSARLSYALTRNIFFSGPDSPNYALAPQDFAQYGFWSTKISGGAFYPQGYPALLWPIARLGGDAWIQITQIFQICLSILTVFIFFKLCSIYFSEKKAVFFSLVFLLYPAFSAMSGQAMYENALMFFFYTHLYIMLKLKAKNQNSWLFFLVAGLIGGYACVIHPRVIPWIILIQFLTFYGKKASHISFYYLVFCGVIGLFMLRNKIAENLWTLSTASEMFKEWIREKGLVETLIDSLLYGAHFWSPHSGEAERSTWFHNFTLYHWIKSTTNSTQLIILISLVWGISAILFWLRGCMLISRTQPHLAKLIFLIPLIAMLTDMFTFGDARHRLVVVPLLVVAQFTTILSLIDKINRYFDEKRKMKIPSIGS